MATDRNIFHTGTQLVKAITKAKVNVRRREEVKASCECGKVRRKLISLVSRSRDEVSVCLRTLIFDLSLTSDFFSTTTLITFLFLK